MKPVQGGEPPKRVDGGSEEAAPSSKASKPNGKPDEFDSHLSASTDKFTKDSASSSDPPRADADPTSPAQSAPWMNDSLNPQRNIPLSVSAFGDVKVGGLGKTLPGLSLTGRATTGTPSASTAGLSSTKPGVAEPTGTPTDLAEAVQAIIGQGASDQDDSASSDTSKGPPLDADPAPIATTVPPDASQTGIFLASAPGAPAPSTSVHTAEASARTVTSLSAQIIDKLGEKVTRFDVALDPAGLGRVNVSVEISAKGQMSARLTFEHPESAAALSKESGALRQALHDAGFQLKPEDLSFQSDGGFSDQGAASQWDDGGRSGARANPFGAMSSFADAADLSAMNAAAGRNAAGGLDIRI